MPRVDRGAAARGRRSRTRSSSLWIVALTGPSSTTSRQMSAMKRPSEVPPVHESSGVHAGDLADRRLGDVDQPAARRQERLAGAGPRELVVEAVPLRASPRGARAATSRVLAVE